MILSEAINKLDEILDIHSEKITAAGFVAAKALEASDKNGEPCALDSEDAECISATVFVGTEGMSTDDMLGFFACFDIKKGELSEEEMANEMLHVNTELDDLIAELKESDDPAGLIKRRGEEAEAEAAAALAEMEKEIKKIELVGKVAAGCLIGIIVILGIIIAIL